MSTQYTAKGSVWINEGGRIVCRAHGGDYLRSAIVHGEGPHIITPLDDWLYHSPEIARLHDLTCEDCPTKRGA